MEIFRPQDSPDQLAPHPHVLELKGSVSRSSWPAICPSCGADAACPLTIRKVFLRRYHHATNRHVIAEARVPFCSACAAEHERTTSVSTPVGRTLSYLRTGLVIPLVGALYMASLTLPAARNPDAGTTTWWAGWGIVAFFGAIAIGSVVAIARATRRFRVPAQTEITRAFDFSDDLSSPFERERRRYAIRNAACAKAVASAHEPIK